MYGLPKSIDGCPINGGFNWESGSRVQDTENVGATNMWSNPLHLMGPYAKNDMQQHFCMKTVDRVDECDVAWPAGQYCVLKYGEDCPKGKFTRYKDGCQHEVKMYGIWPSL